MLIRSSPVARSERHSKHESLCSGNRKYFRDHQKLSGLTPRFPFLLSEPILKCQVVLQIPTRSIRTTLTRARLGRRLGSLAQSIPTSSTRPFTSPEKVAKNAPLPSSSQQSIHHMPLLTWKSFVGWGRHS